MISVVILTYNRQDVLFENLTILNEQTSTNKEILVVDNGNNVETRNLVEKHFPATTYIPMESNIGCGARNFGLQAAKGDVIVTLDDDVLMASDLELAKIDRIFKSKPGVDVVNFKIVFENGHQIIPFNWYHPRDYHIYGDEEFETDYIGEGAVAFRKEIFARAGYYPAEFYLAHEGPDLAYRIIDAGYTIIYSPEIAVVHKVDGKHRPGWRNSYFDTRNQMWLGVRNLRPLNLITHLTYRLLTTFLFCVARGHVVWYFRALRDALKELPRELRNHRRPISRETMRRLREIRRYNPGWIRVVRNFAEKIHLVKGYYN